MNSKLDLVDLKLFLSIVDSGSITQGAYRSNLALASASERIRKLEQDLGIALLIRKARGVATTEAGEALAHHARLILKQSMLLEDELQDFATGARGSITLYANTAALMEFLPAKLAVWLEGWPKLTVVLKERTSEEIVKAVQLGLAEVGIVSSSVPATGLITRPLTNDNLVLIVPSTHKFTINKKVDFERVLFESMVGLTSGDALQSHIEAQARKLGKTLNVRIRLKTFESVCQLVCHGVGVGIVPEQTAKRFRRKFGFGVVRLHDSWATRQLNLCYKESEQLSPAMCSLLRYLEANSNTTTRAVIVGQPKGRC